MNAYTEIRDSSISWIGKIPKHWNVTVLKRVLSEPLKYGATEAGDCTDRDLPRYLRITDFDTDGRLRDDTFASLPEEIAQHYYVKEGDVLFARSGATVGKTFLFRNHQGRACFAGYLIKASSLRQKLTPQFLYYFTKSPAYEAWKDFIFTQATIQNIGADKYAYLPVCLPPLSEQERIAAYLDASCAAIDAAVDIKRRQIETLDGLRSVALHATFASDGWPTKRIKDVAKKIRSGVTPIGGSSSYLDEGIPLLRSQNVHFDGLHLDDVAFISAEIHADMASSQIKPRDVLVNITGASIGRCTYVPDDFGEGNVNQHVCTIRGNEKVDHKFLAAFLSSPIGQGQILSSFTGASRQGLSHKELALIRVPLPPADVQRETVTIIERDESQRSKLRTIINLQIETLTAYRKSLIHECVTGQRRISEADVRCVSQDSGLDQEMLAEAGV